MTIPFFLAMALMANYSFSQTTTEPTQRPPEPAGQRVSSPADSQSTNSGQLYQSQTGGADVTFTNAAGQTFTVDQFVADLRQLNDSVARAMPALTAFNSSFGSTTGRNLAGAISNLVSGALNRNASQSTSQSGQSSAAMAALQGRLRGTGANPNNLTDDLSKLQRELQPVAPLLQDMLGTTAGGQPSSDQVISAPRTNAPITPTGR